MKRSNNPTKNRLSAGAIVGTAFLFLALAPALAGERGGQAAIIGMDEARASALKIYPGIIMKEELEKERGGLRYSFDIRSGKKWREVGIDAKTGRVVENRAEAPYPKD